MTTKLNLPPKSRRPAQRPAMFVELAGRYPTTHGGITAAVNALAEGYGTFIDQCQKTNADATQNEAARLVRNAKRAHAKFAPLIANLDSASSEAAAISENLRGIAAATYCPANPSYSACMRQQEIRAYFRSLPQTERLKLLDDARTAGDEDTLIAVASVQSYLSQVPPQMQEYVRDHLIQTHAPEEAATIKAISEQRAQAEQFRGLMLQSLADLIDFQKADELIAAANDELAA